MVQLKLFPVLHNMVSTVSFQFHNGTIKTQTIIVNQNIYVNFNSIMVQLKLLSAGHVKVQIVLFQFHNGTIKTCLAIESIYFPRISIP